MKKALFLFSFFLCFLSLSAQKDLGDKAYKNKRYSEALTYYGKAAKTERSFALFNNIGSAYYHLNKLPEAILFYERAHLLAPGNGAVRHNLALCKAKLPMQIHGEGGLFFALFAKRLARSGSVDFFAVSGMIAFALTAVCILLFRISTAVRVKKLCFYFGILFFLLFVCFNVFAYLQKDHYENNADAVLMKASPLRVSPVETSKQTLSLCAGLTVKILLSEKGWNKVELADGRSGWVQSQTLKKIKE